MRRAPVALLLAGGAAAAPQPTRTPAAPTPWAARPYTALGAYNGPFTLLTLDYLSGVAEPADNFGAEDKLVACNGKLVFVDLDMAGGELFSYDRGSGAWSKQPIVALPCDDGVSSLLVRAGWWRGGAVWGVCGVCAG